MRGDLRMKPYPVYKDSGIEWIGEVPEDWNHIKFKFVTSLMTCGHAATPEYVDEDEGFPFFSAQNIKNDKIDLYKYNFVTKELYEQLTKNHKIEKGDILQVRVGGATTIGLTAVVDFDMDFCIYVSLSHIKLNKRVFSGFIKHLCNSFVFREYSSLIMKKGAGVANLNVSDLERIPIPIASLTEQHSIATYLDQKTQQIDRLIEIKQKQIELLKEQRTAIINQAVTKGLNPDVPMKDSGIEWLGEIPEHWEEIALCRVVNPYRKITYGIVQPGEQDKNGVFMVRGQDYSTGWTEPEKIFKVSPKIEEPYARARLSPEDILLTIVGAGVGNTAIVPEWLDQANITQTTARIAVDIEKGIDSFFRYVLDSNVGKTNIELSVKGAAQPGLNLAHIAKYRVPLPPLSEQTTIATYLNHQTQQIDQLAESTQTQITQLQEYRTALISAVVTGKIDVRDEIAA